LLPSHSPKLRNSSVRKKVVIGDSSNGSSYCATKVNQLV
jgi:hypothetical protein